MVLSPAVAWAQSGAADLGVTVADTPDPVPTGENLTYTITVINNGPDSATDASLTGGLPPGTTFVSLTVPGGWVCVTPPVGAGGTISCSHLSLPVGLVSVFTLQVDTSSTAPNAVLTSTFSVQSSVSDPDAANGTSTATTLVAPPLLRIHVIQGGGAESPFANGAVTVRGIVTGVTSDGFFVQEEDADVDANANTSEGIFVFTSTPPPPAAAFKAQVQVSGTVAEFVPGSDPQQPPSTQLVSPTTVQLDTDQPLPAPFVLAPTFPDPAGSFDQLERLEHMRVTAGSITVTGPSGGSIDEANATGTSDGRFYGVITGIARPFRESGIRQRDLAPSGSIPPIPRWDFNPERLRIASAAINAQPPLTVRAGDLVGPVTGPLDYAARAFAIYPDGEVSISVTPGALSTTVSAPAAGEITVASFNLQRFFDTVDDAYGDPVLTAAAYSNRLAKASIAIRNHLRGPDIIGVQEVEKLSVLADLANTILADGGPAYDPYVVEGNDSVGLDVGFLVKTDLVPGGQPRVSNVSVTQVGQATTWIDPSSNAAALLNERPPLVLEATVNRTSTATFPLVAIVGHLVDLTGIDSVTMAGLTTQGDFVRRKRQAQAEFLANYVQGRLTANPGEHLVVIGDFRAFEVNDGYVDVMNVVAGTPPPDNETVIAGDGVDLVNPDLVNLVNTPPVAERYSEVHEGNARNVDHALVSAGLVADTTARRIEHPRIGADYPETERNDNTSALRVSDQDPVVAYFATSALALADLEVTVADSPDPVAPGQNLIYTITVTNAGPDDAATASLSDTLPANTTFVALAVPGGWLCTTPAVGAGGAITCSTATSGATSTAVFTLSVQVTPSIPPGAVLANTVVVSSSTSDGDPGDNSATATTIVPGPSVPSGNQAPTLGGLGDLTIEESTAQTLTLTIGDDATPAGNLSVTATSSNEALLPNSGLALAGSGGTRSLTLTPLPGQVGQTTLTVSVSDGALSTTHSALVTVITAAPPLPPTDLAGGATGNDVTLAWREPTAGATPTFYVIEGGSAPGLTTMPVIVTPARATQWTLKLPPGVYSFRVRAANRFGTSAASNEAQVVVTIPVPIPAAPTAFAALVDGPRVTLQWQAASGGGDAASWQLEVGSTAGASNLGVISLPPGVTSVSGTLPTGEFYARVRGVNSAGAGQSSNETRFRIGELTACGALQPPVLLPATLTDHVVTLTWRAPGDIAVSAYRLLVGSTPGGSDLAVLDAGPVTSLVAWAPTGIYYVTVLAVDNCGTSSPSNSITVNVGLLHPPANLASSVSGHEVALSWSAVAGAASYLLEAGYAPGTSDAVSVPVGGTGLVTPGVPSGTYYVRVRAVSAGGVTSAPSVEIMVVVP